LRDVFFSVVIVLVMAHGAVSQGKGIVPEQGSTHRRPARTPPQQNNSIDARLI